MAAKADIIDGAQQPSNRTNTNGLLDTGNTKSNVQALNNHMSGRK